MYRVLKINRDGTKREMLVNTATWNMIKERPGVFGSKYELVIEKPKKPIVTIVKPKEPTGQVLVEYSEADYKADVALAKKEPTVEILERMVKYKSTPYWKGKLNKLK